MPKKVSSQKEFNGSLALDHIEPLESAIWLIADLSEAFDT